MNYSPKLKKAMEEIKAIVDKYNIAAAVVLHTPGHSEHYLAITPRYCCIKLDGNQLRLRYKRSDYLSAEDQRTVLRNTSNMVELLFVTTGKVALQIDQIRTIVNANIDSDHTGETYTSQEEIDN